MLGTYVPFIHLILTKTFGGRWLCPHFPENKQAQRGGEGHLSVAIMVSGAEEGVHGHIRWFLSANFMERCLKRGFLVGRHFLLSWNAGKGNF